VKGLLLPGIAIAFLAFATAAAALAPEAVDADDTDRSTFDAVIEKAETRSFASLPFNELIQAMAFDEALQGKDYVRAPLEHEPDRERVYAGFARFDCVTYVETVLALSETIARHERSFDDYAAHLASLRYRNGEPAYCDRLHYFSDWIRSGVAAGRLDDVTSLVAGSGANLAFAAEPQGLNFMSRNAATIPALATDASRLACVQRSEEAISVSLAHATDGTPGFAYIPKARLGEVLERLQGGDIVAWVAEQPGLDVIHVGIVVRRGRPVLGFAHASLRTGGVAVAPDLQAYAKTLSRQRGLIVLRPRADGIP